MSDDRTVHVHRYRCGVSWTCQKPDCRLDDECTNCELAIFEQYAEQHHWTVSQPELPELAHQGGVKS